MEVGDKALRVRFPPQENAISGANEIPILRDGEKAPQLRGVRLSGPQLFRSPGDRRRRGLPSQTPADARKSAGYRRSDPPEMKEPEM